MSDLNISNYNYGDILKYMVKDDLLSLVYGSIAKNNQTIDYEIPKKTMYKLIGENGVFVKSSDSYGLTIPYEITKNLTDAVSKYKNIKCSLELDCDDIFIKTNIGSIPRSWNFKLIYSQNLDKIIVRFPNNKSQEFDLKTSPYKINTFYKSTLKPQSSVELHISMDPKTYWEKEPMLDSAF